MKEFWNALTKNRYTDKLLPASDDDDDDDDENDDVDDGDDDDDDDDDDEEEEEDGCTGVIASNMRKLRWYKRRTLRDEDRMPFQLVFFLFSLFSIEKYRFSVWSSKRKNGH